MTRWIWLAAALASPALAQYKCVIDGRTTYAERPCSSNARPMDIKVPQASDDEWLAAQKRQRRDEREARRFVDRSAAEQSDIDRRTSEHRSGVAAKNARCQQLLADAEASDHDSREYRHAAIVEDALRRKKAAQDAHFSECYAR